MTEKACSTCGAWQPAGKAGKNLGECRKTAPVISGWPKTIALDWCCQWFKKPRQDAHKSPAPKQAEEKRWQIGINYVFVRDYPELATTWLQAALAKPDDIPEELHAVLANPFGQVLTDFLPDWVDGAPCCERLLHRAEQLPGFCNDDAAADDEYCGLLISMADKKEIAADTNPRDAPMAANRCREGFSGSGIRVKAI